MPPKREPSRSLTPPPSSALSSAPQSPKRQRARAGTPDLGVLSPADTPASSSSSSLLAGATAEGNSHSTTLTTRTRRKTSVLPEAGPSKVSSAKAVPKRRPRATTSASAGTDAPPAQKKRKTALPSIKSERHFSPSPEPSVASSTPRSARRPSPVSSLTAVPTSPVRRPSPSRSVSPASSAPPKKRVFYDSDSEDEVFSLTKVLDKASAAKRQRLDTQSMSSPVRAKEPTPPPFRPSRLPSGVYIGDPCLVKERTCYFVAVLLAFHPATTLEEQKKRSGDKYEVEDQSGKRRIVPRKSIVFEIDPQLATVKIGHVKEVRVKGVEVNAAQRMTAEFKELDREQQLTEIKRHLHAIIKEEYAPAQWRNDMFFEGRTRYLNEQASSGDIPEDEVQNLIIPWLLRWSEGKEDVGADEAARCRPEGSARYNEVAIKQRVNYVTNVLLPEAVIELCIRSYGLTGSPDEQYAEAKAKLDELANRALKWRQRRTTINNCRRKLRREQNLESDEDDDEERRRLEYDITHITSIRQRKAPVRLGDK